MAIESKMPIVEENVTRDRFDLPGNDEIATDSLRGVAVARSPVKPVQSSGHHVFLSYQSAYTEIVEKLREELIN